MSECGNGTRNLAPTTVPMDDSLVRLTQSGVEFGVSGTVACG